MERAKSAAADTAQTARHQVREVGGELRAQAEQAVDHLRGRVRDEAESQSRRAARSIRNWADDLATMTESGKPDSPVQGVMYQVAGGGRRAADYLEERGLGGAADDLQRFARRRPGLFLAGALAAGFVVGRIVKSGAEVARDDQDRDERRLTGEALPASYPANYPATYSDTTPSTSGTTSGTPDDTAYGTTYGTPGAGTQYGTPSGTTYGTPGTGTEYGTPGGGAPR